MLLKLKNPIIFLDLETTGINIASDRIVEIALIKVSIDGSEEEKSLRINPGVPIPQETSEIHGIYDEDIKDEPTFKEVAKMLAKFMEGCDLGGFNSSSGKRFSGAGSLTSSMSFRATDGVRDDSPRLTA